MSNVIELTDELYGALEKAAQNRGEAPANLVAQWIEEMSDLDREPRYFETDDWFRHLGATEEQIAESKRIAVAHGLEDADA